MMGIAFDVYKTIQSQNKNHDLPNNYEFFDFENTEFKKKLELII